MAHLLVVLDSRAAVPEDDMSEAAVLEDNMLEVAVPEDDMPEVAVPEDNVPEAAVLEDDMAEADVVGGTHFVVDEHKADKAKAYSVGMDRVKDKEPDQ